MCRSVRSRKRRQTESIRALLAESEAFSVPSNKSGQLYARPRWRLADSTPRRCNRNKQKYECALNAEIVAMCRFSRRHTEQKPGKGLY
jgi:hypothetical protein